MAISVAWIPVIATFHTSQLFLYVQAISNFLAPPVAAIYVLAILWPRLTEPVSTSTHKENRQDMKQAMVMINRFVFRRRFGPWLEALWLVWFGLASSLATTHLFAALAFLTQDQKSSSISSIDSTFFISEASTLPWHVSWLSSWRPWRNPYQKTE